MSYLIALFGILMSGLVATLATYHLNATKEHVFFMRNKSAIKSADKSDKNQSILLLMLIDIYFPAVKPTFEKFSEQRQRLNKIVEDHKRAHESGMAETKFIKPFQEVMGELDAKSKELKQAIIFEGQKCAGVDRLWPWKKISKG